MQIKNNYVLFLNKKICIIVSTIREINIIQVKNYYLIIHSIPSIDESRLVIDDHMLDVELLFGHVQSHILKARMQ